MATNTVATAHVIDTSAVVALLIAATGVEEFPPRMWPHHRALHQLSRAVAARSDLRPAMRGWTFRPSADGGYALDGLDATFLRLCGAQWLRRRTDPVATYEVTPRLREWGWALHALLSPADRAAVDAAAQRLSATLRVSSKNAR